jgi:hypothetical protein
MLDKINLLVWRVKMFFWERNYASFRIGLGLDPEDDDETPEMPPDLGPSCTGQMYAVPVPSYLK